MIWIIVGCVFGIALAVVLAGAIIENAQVREDLEDVPASPGLRPEEAERPFPLPHKVDPVTPDRPLYFAAPADEEGFERARRKAQRQADEVHKWLADVAVEIEELVPLVREGDDRG